MKGRRLVNHYGGYCSEWKDEAKKGDTQRGVMLSKVGKAAEAGNTAELLELTKAAMKAGAAPTEVVFAMGGQQKWQAFLYNLKREGILE